MAERKQKDGVEDVRPDLSAFETGVERHKIEERYRNFIQHDVAGVYRYEARKPMPLDLPVDEQIEWMMDQGVLVEANQMVARLHGLDSVEPLIGLTFREIYSSDEQTVRELLRTWIKLKYANDGYERLETNLSGERRWFLMMSHGIIESNHLVGSWGATIDITERKQAEMALAESEERYRALVESSLLGIGLSRGNRVVLANRALLDVFGYDTLEEFTRMPLLDHVAPASRPLIIDRMEAVARGQAVAPQFEYDVVRRDGSIRTLQAYSSRVLVQDEIHTQTTFLDVTAAKQAEAERRLAEEALRRERELLREIAANYPNSYISIIEKDLTVGFTAGQEFKKQNLNPYDYVGLTLDQVFGESAPVVREHYLKAFAGEETEFELFFNQQHQLFRVVPLREKTGQVDRVLAVVENATERKRAEAALAESESKFRQLSEKAVVGIYVIQDGRLAYVNPCLAGILGYEPEEMIDKLTLADVIHPDDIDIVTGRFTERLAGETMDRNITYRALKKDGSQAHIEVYGQRIEYRGKPAVLGTAIDVTDRHQAESRYRAIFNATNAAILVSTLEGAVVDANEAFVALSGYSREELRTIDFQDFYVNTDDRSRLREAFQRDGQLQNHEMLVRTKSGLEKWVSISGRPIIQRGETCLFSIVVDVSERKRAEAALRASEAQLSTALQMARAGHWEYDVGRDTFTFNDNFYRIFRTTAAEVGGYQMSSAEYAQRFCHPDDMAMVGSEVRAAIEASDPNYDRQLEHRILFADGEVGQISVRFFIVKDSQGRTVKTYGVNQDITERKRLQAQIAQSDRLASMGMLAAGIAHEVNNPLTYVLYNLESLTDDLPKLSSALRRCLERGAERLGHEEWAKLLGPDRELLNPAMIDDVGARFEDALLGTLRIRDIARGLGTFSRVEQDRKVPVDLMQVIEVAINMVFNEIKYRARLVKEYGKVSSILANDGRLSQVFLNLLVNAAHAIEEGDVERNEIRVRTWQDRNEVLAEVRDTGKGIPAEHLPFLFEPFFTTKEFGVGTGLGLSISKSIVEGYGGRIEVSSTVGEGTSFVVRLPVDRVEDYEEAGLKKSTPVQPEVRGRVLVIDDETAVRSAIVRLLRGNEVVQAASGEDARKILRADQAFDLILCDMMMPAMSGVDLHEWLSKLYPALADRVVFITGGAFTPRAREFLARVGYIRIEKPFDAANFKKIVHDRIIISRQGEKKE